MGGGTVERGELADIACKGGRKEVADRRKDKGRLSEQESSLEDGRQLPPSRRKAATEAEETPSPLAAPPGADTRRHRKVILHHHHPPPPSTLTDCQSQISSSALSISTGPHKNGLFVSFTST